MICSKIINITSEIHNSSRDVDQNLNQTINYTYFAHIDRPLLDSIMGVVDIYGDDVDMTDLDMTNTSQYLGVVWLLVLIVIMLLVVITCMCCFGKRLFSELCSYQLCFTLLFLRKKVIFTWRVAEDEPDIPRARAMPPAANLEQQHPDDAIELNPRRLNHLLDVAPPPMIGVIIDEPVD